MDASAKSLQNLIARVEKLEQAVFRSKKGKSVAKSASTNYAGATGGIRLLIDGGFFDKKRAFGEVCKALQDKGYHYSFQAVQTPLNRLSSVSGPLVGLKQQGRKVYAKRK